MFFLYLLYLHGNHIIHCVIFEFITVSITLYYIRCLWINTNYNVLGTARVKIIYEYIYIYI